MADAQNLGYAVALVEQLGANLVEERLQALHTFTAQNLEEKKAFQLVKDLNSQDVVNILFEVLLAASENLALLGPIKKAIKIWDDKHRPARRR